MKKIITFILIFSLLFSCLTINSFALEPQEINGYKIYYSNGFNDKSIYYYVLDKESKYQPNFKDINFLPEFPEKFYNISKVYSIVQNGTDYYLYFSGYNLRLIDVRGNGSELLFWSDKYDYLTNFNVYCYKFNSLDKGSIWQFVSERVYSSVPNGSKFIFSSADLTSGITGQTLVLKTDFDYVYTTIALSHFQYYFNKYIKDLLPFGCFVFISFVSVRLIRKLFNPKIRKGVRQPKWKRKLFKM